MSRFSSIPAPVHLEQATRLVWVQPDGSFTSIYEDTAPVHPRTLVARCYRPAAVGVWFPVEHLRGVPAPSCSCGVYVTSNLTALAQHAGSMHHRMFELSPRPTNEDALPALVSVDAFDCLPAPSILQEAPGTYRAASITYNGAVAVAGELSSTTLSGITANYGIPASRIYNNPGSTLVDILYALGAEGITYTPQESA